MYLTPTGISATYMHKHTHGHDKDENGFVMWALQNVRLLSLLAAQVSSGEPT